MRNGGYCRRVLLLCCLLPLGAAHAASAPQVEEALSAQQRAAAESQRRIDGLDDATRKSLLEYRAALLRAEQLRLYERQLEAQLQTQKERLASIEADLGRVEQSRAAMVPLQVRMSDALEAFIAADQPFGLEERQARLAKLRQQLSDPEVGLSAQYRALYEAWQAEAADGQRLAAERVSLPGSGSGQLVDLLRIGRLALFAMSLDASEAWIWNRDSRRFSPLPASALPGLKQALRVAQEQAAPSLLALPVEGAR